MILADSDFDGLGVLTIAADSDGLGGGDLETFGSTALHGAAVGLSGDRVIVDAVSAHAGDVSVAGSFVFLKGNVSAGGNVDVWGGSGQLTSSDVTDISATGNVWLDSESRVAVLGSIGQFQIPSSVQINQRTAAPGYVTTNGPITSTNNVLVSGQAATHFADLTSLLGSVRIDASSVVVTSAITANANTLLGGHAIHVSSASNTVFVNGPWNATGVPDLSMHADGVGVDLNANVTASGSILVAADNDLFGLASVNVTSATGNIVLIADADGDNDGTISFEADINHGDGGTFVSVTDAYGSIGGVISGIGGFTKNGFGTLALTAHNTFSGVTTLNEGTLLIEGSVGAGVTVNGGTLGGSGTIDGGPVSMVGSGSVAPGDSPGRLTVDDDVVLVSAGSFNVELDGTMAGDEYDQLQVTGGGRGVTLNDAVLHVTLGFAPAHSDSFVIIDNVESDSSVVGTFQGLPEGSALSADGEVFLITYMGGDGNDVVLTNVKLVSLSVTNSVAEDGATNILYTLTRTGTASGELIVNLDVTGTALFGTDYTQSGAADFATPTGSVTITDGNATATVYVDPTADAVVELDESVGLTIEAGTGYAVGAAHSATASILNDDIATLTIRDVVRQEGNAGLTPFSFAITLDRLVDRDVDVDVSTQDGTATLGDSDYIALNQSITIPALTTSVNVIVDVIGDKKVESDIEEFTLRVGNLVDAGVVFAGGADSLAAAGLIINDDVNLLTATPIVGVTQAAGRTSLTFTNPATGIARSVTPFAANFAGGATVGAGDINGDGVPEVIAAAGPGGGPHIQIFDSAGEVVSEFFAFGGDFRGGVNMAVGDFNRDGIADIVAAAGSGGGPHVKVFDGSRLPHVLFDFFAYSPGFSGGVRVAVDDINGDGIHDIVTAPGPGGGPNVKVFDGSTGQAIKDFFAFDPSFTGGVLISTGDFNGDKFGDIITAAGSGGGPAVAVRSGQDLSTIGSFLAYDPVYKGGVQVTGADLRGDGITDVIVGPADNTPLGKQLFAGSTFQLDRSFTPTQLNQISTLSSATPVGNVAPIVLNEPQSLNVTRGKAVHWTVPRNVFFDENVQDTLSLSASLANGSALPAWLSFNTTTNTLTGVSDRDSTGIHMLRLTADDGHGGSVSTSFDLNLLTPARPGRPVVTSPAFDGVVADLTPRISWNDDVNASRYDVSIVDVSTGQQVARDKNVTTPWFEPTAELSSGVFDVRLRAANVFDAFSPWSRTHHVRILIGAPARPIPTQPVGTIADATPEFTWTQDVNTDRVELSIVSNSTHSEVARVRNIQTNSYTLTSPLPSGSYRYNLQAWNELDARSGWTVAESFSINLPVPSVAPEITKPTAAGTVRDSRPTITWRSVADAAFYNLVVTDASSGRVLIDRTGLTSTSFTPSNPIGDGTYRVVVTGTNEAGTAGPSSDAVTFTIALGHPERPVIVAPGLDIANPRPTFMWTPVAGVVEYQLWLTNNTTGVSPYLRMVRLTGTVATATRDLTPGDYSVWIKAISVNGTHRWSLEHRFSVEFDVVTLNGESLPLPVAGETSEQAESAALIEPGELLAFGRLEPALERMAVLPTDNDGAEVAKRQTHTTVDDQHSTPAKDEIDGHESDGRESDGRESDAGASDAGESDANDFAWDEFSLNESEADRFFAECGLVADLMA